MSSELEVDQMVEDIYGQDEKKKRKDLRDIPQYQNNEYVGDEDFNSAVITPPDITVKDLLPTEYIRATKKEMTENRLGREVTLDGQFNIDTREIRVRKGMGKKKENDTLLHENIHKQWREHYFNSTKILEEDSADIPDFAPVYRNKQITSKFNKDIEKSLKKMVYNEPYLKGLDEATKKDVLNYKRREVINPGGYLLMDTNEPLARFGELYPNEIINPTTKTGKKLNRLWFE